MSVKTEQKSLQNRGFCSKCNKIVPVRHETRGGCVFLQKQCPDCGQTEALISTDAERYQEKRDLVGYEGEARKTCSLDCTRCSAHKPPTLVFLDITNRCNMNCPICLANIPAMGFRFDPPTAYFEKIFEALSRISPPPKIQIFGGEPTVRKDLFDIIHLARDKYGLSARVVTNGLKLADEQYCKDLIETGAELMFSFDGRSPEIYQAMRKHPEAYEKKLRALENISKHRQSKVTIMCAVGESVNDIYMADMIDFCHENRSYIAALDLIPLTAEWGPEQVELQSATIEGVESIMQRALPGMEFFPAGMIYQLETLRNTFDIGRMTFGGAHPNCETVSVLISDGEKYHPISKFINLSLEQFMAKAVALDKRMGEKLPRSIFSRIFGRKGRQIRFGYALLKFIRRSIQSKEIFPGGAAGAFARIIWGLLRGRQLKVLLRANTKLHGILRVIILPFEEKECVESARLVDCPAAFAFEQPETGEVGLMPVCSWPAYKNDVLRATAERYGVDNSKGDDGLTGLKRREELEKEDKS